MKTESKAGSLLYSSIYAGGIYEDTGEVMTDPLRRNMETPSESCIVRNVLSGDRYYLKISTGGEKEIARYRERILLPPDRTHILWPEDIISLEEGKELTPGGGMIVEQDYSAMPKSDAERRGRYALLFAAPDDPTVYVDSRTRIREAGKRSWKNPRMRQVAKEILLAVESINRSGYAYQDIHLSRLFFKEGGQAYFDFSNLIYRFSEIASPRAAELCCPAEGEYPMDFAEPAFRQGWIPCMDLHTQNYSITALLFYLLFGRYPYQGCLLRHYDLDIENPLIHFTQFRDYYKTPVFVFDPENTSNALGTYTSDQDEIDAWNECPDPVREYFLRTLRQENAERDVVENVYAEAAPGGRKKYPDNPTPAMWLDAFAQAGW